MGLNHSPKIVTSGLVFAYDMGNTNKSWKGTPTTNRLPNATEFSGWSNYYRTLAKTSFTTQFGTTGWRFINQPSWSGIAIGYTVPSTGTYTFSAYYKYLGGSASNNGGTVYVYDGISNYAVGVNKNLIGVWQRVQMTLNLTTLTGTYYLISYGGTDSGTTSPDNTSFEVTMPMIESGSLATPFVDGTRSSTQAVLDLTGLNTVTASSLTYNSDNTFSFNGSSNYIDLATNIQSGFTSASYEFWCRPTSLPSAGIYYQLYIQEASTWIGLYNTGGFTFFGIDLNNGSGWFDNNGGINTGARTTSTLTANIFYHVCYTWAGGIVKVYLNGNQQASVSTLQAANGRQNVTSLGAGTTSRNIGSRYSGTGNNWVGSIPVVKFYNKALSASEVQQNFNAHRGRYGI